MEIVPLCIFMALFLIGGLKDLNRRKIDDFTSSLLWIAYAAVGHELLVLVASFGTMWFIVNLIEEKTGKLLMAWADLLWAPVLIALLTELMSFQFAVAVFGLTLLAGQINLYFARSVNKTTPFVLYMAVALWASFLIVAASTAAS